MFFTNISLSKIFCKKLNGRFPGLQQVIKIKPSRFLSDLITLKYAVYSGGDRSRFSRDSLLLLHHQAALYKTIKLLYGIRCQVI